MKDYSAAFFIAILSISFISCTKSVSVTNSVNINNQTIAGTYKITAITAKDNASGVQIDAYSQLQDCQKDDLEILSSNGTYQYIDAGVRCNPPGNVTGVWSVSGSKITLDTTTGDIEKFDGKTLVVVTTQTFGGSTYTVTSTYTKQ